MVILIIIYILSTIHQYWYFSSIFSKGGKWETESPDVGAFIWTFVPLCNTVAVLFGWMLTGSPYRRESSLETKLNNFFTKLFDIKK